MNFIKHVANSRNIKVYCDDNEAIKKALGNTDFYKNGQLSADGYAVDYHNLENPIVLFKREADKEKRRFTIAHELGHIFAGHLSFEDSKGNSDLRELEASMIGAVLFGLSIYEEYKNSQAEEGVLA